MALHCSSSSRRYSCESAAQTLEWMKAITDFLTPFKPLLNAHVVNFFKDRLWESIDREWMDCLRREPVENLLKIPSGIVQESWPASLKEFIFTSRSLVLPREPGQLQTILPDLHVASIGSVLAQGMNMKKKHEVEILAAVVNTIANCVGARTVLDVGAGQGYLAQVLSFEYHFSVIAIDASSHHGTITSARSERMKKHYAAKIHKSQAGNKDLKVPQTVTCQVLSSDTLKTLSATLLCKANVEPSREVGKSTEAPILEGFEVNGGKQSSSFNDQSIESPLVLAGLHACGDLSATMLRTLLDCKEVKALVSIGCCYNLLSEECSENTTSTCGFPMSDGAKLPGFSLGKNARDLACQSAERWRSLTKDAALQNFEVHAFRAAFQMVILKYYPNVLITSPSIGRQGKAMRRQQLRRVLQSQLSVEEHFNSPSVAKHEHSEKDADLPIMKSIEVGGIQVQHKDFPSKDDKINTCAQSAKKILYSGTGCEQTQSFRGSDKFMLFEEFSKSGLSRLGLSSPCAIDLLGIWKDAQPFSELVGPYWSLRATLGPVVETFLLLDRLLFLQERHTLVPEVTILPLFDPTLSPRNLAIIARKF
ncbi:uncharacterized protein LOC131245698 isoform X3 [Magnolia sinica]|uniref:uncharacterized protein LOC131245698 isoform X3 n=1 Tax=Magnolia sinica TaxID=86752 RepID=UPI00265AED4F|nr:uncharacterized protein LOC131245698 isoform X3 [Magnolia sinica]XP_058101358.1 uncharacterized protein LOC131245698 isoform X3 [Magnolia sinica]XP_058101367.1 uncharacterized protein LOC131245698 isoform X3 [Magnolia sinica]XP_058101375.1 uncharacterized protein LOC131245698 isoform X3 [Magnolia sinica]XP_058101385.1 uncharacterized protein LOC131245698 isoform X3 [Magnolia sinica]